jgi:RNA polymerase sigma-70 factor (ECF subfamily)
VAFEPLDNAAEGATAEPMTAGVTADLDQMLSALRPAEREVIYLHHVDGHTAKEVGVLTSQPRGTVLSLLNRAMKKLRGAADRIGG